MKERLLYFKLAATSIERQNIYQFFLYKLSLGNVDEIKQVHRIQCLTNKKDFYKKKSAARCRFAGVAFFFSKPRETTGVTTWLTFFPANCFAVCLVTGVCCDMVMCPVLLVAIADP